MSMNDYLNDSGDDWYNVTCSYETRIEFLNVYTNVGRKGNDLLDLFLLCSFLGCFGLFGGIVQLHVDIFCLMTLFQYKL